MVYEVEHYREMRRFLPHIKQKVRVNGRDGLVTGLDILNQRVKVKFEDGGYAEPFHVDEIEIPGKNKKANTENPAKIAPSIKKSEEFTDLNTPKKTTLNTSISDRIKRDIELAAQRAKKTKS
jgi:cell fate regulator YaaT (PSP1 superfamily)